MEQMNILKYVNDLKSVNCDVAKDNFNNISAQEFLKCLQYLEGKGLIELLYGDDRIMDIAITRHGEKYLESK